MTKRRWLVLLVGVIALGMVAHGVIAEDEQGPPRRGRGPRAGRGRPDGDRPEGRPEGKPDGEGGERRGRPDGEGGRRPMMRRPVSPLMRVLDVNKDGKLDKQEIANASAVLAKLAGDDGVITREELRPKRPEGGKDGDRPEGGKGGPRRGRGRGPGGGGEGGKGRGPGGGGGEGGRRRGPGGGGGGDRPE